ncbi:MAG: DUF6597 domain-containing transcriptional factor [Thermoanaerobaculia bacterium]
MYAENRPPAALRDVVECFWTSDATAQPATILPDGCADIIFDVDSEEAFVVGTMTRPLVVPPDKLGKRFGVRFRPGRLSQILRVPLSELTDATVRLRDIRRGLQVRVDSIEADLLRLRGDSDRRVDAAVRAIAGSGGTTDIDTLAQSIGVTRQHLARLFARDIGVSPKMFARIMRFRSAVQLGSGQPWADVAAQLGYTDQSHLIADFREFSGTTPVPFFLSLRSDAA